MLLHITTRNEWKSAQDAGVYRAESLETEGFIHCSTPEQVLGPANSFYRGRDNLVLLVIDPSLLTADVVYEDLYESGVEFPHLYGALNMDAVTAVFPFEPLPDGTFELPPL